MALKRTGIKSIYSKIEEKTENPFDYGIISADRGYNSESELVKLYNEQKEESVKFEDFEFLKPLG